MFEFGVRRSSHQVFDSIERGLGVWGRGWDWSTQEQRNSHNRNCVIVKDGRDIFRRELVRCITDEKTGLADGTVTDDDAPRSDKESQRSVKVGLGITGVRKAVS